MNSIKSILWILLAAWTAGPGFAKDKSLAQGKKLNIVFIGNSITQGVIIDDPEKAPPAQAVKALESRKGILCVDFYNNGVSGSTTIDHLPQTGTLFSRTIEAADRFAADQGASLVFSIKLGTNDSASEGPNGSPVTPDQYRKNLKTIIDSLLSRYPQAYVVLHHPVWYSPSTYNGARYLQEGLDRLCSYVPEIDALVKEYRKKSKAVFVGDTAGFDYFREHHKTDMWEENGQTGVFYLHPNIKGAEALGRLWAEAIYKAVR